MAASVQIGKKITGFPFETDAINNEYVYDPANISWSAADESVASFAVQPDGSALFTPLKAGSTQVTVSDTKFNLTFSDTLTVTDTPTGLVIHWGDPE